MKITGDLPTPELDPKKTSNATAKTGRAQPVQPVSGDGQDSVQISQRGQALLQLSARAEAAPVAESDRLESIRQAVNDGRYAYSSDLVADRILDSLAHHPEGI